MDNLFAKAKTVVGVNFDGNNNLKEKKDMSNNVPNTFGVQIKNNSGKKQRIALFPGSVPTQRAITKKLGDDVFETDIRFDSPKELNNLSYGVFDAVADDGVMVGTEVQGVSCFPAESMFSFRHLLKWLASGNACKINKIIMKTTTQDQFDNQILVATTNPIVSYGQKLVNPSKYSTPDLMVSNKIVIDDLNIMLQDDTLIGLTINDGETINFTLELEGVA